MESREEAEELFKKIRPYSVSHLYKYRSMRSEGLEEIFTKRQVYLNDATTFDDPFESRPQITYHQDWVKRERYLKQLIQQNYPSADKKTRNKLREEKRHFFIDLNILKSAYDIFIKSTGIYCLTEKNNELLMWSLYSESHKGLCLEFDASKQGTLFCEALKVIYQEGYPEVNIMDMGNTAEYQKALLTKSLHWQYQEEWRIIKPKPSGGPGYYAFPPELLTGVILGSLMSDPDKALLMRWVDKYPVKINVFEARLNDIRFQIDIVQTH